MISAMLKKVAKRPFLSFRKPLFSDCIIPKKKQSEIRSVNREGDRLPGEKELKNENRRKDSCGGELHRWPGYSAAAFMFLHTST